MTSLRWTAAAFFCCGACACSSNPGSSGNSGSIGPASETRGNSSTIGVDAGNVDGSTSHARAGNTGQTASNPGAGGQSARVTGAGGSDQSAGAAGDSAAGAGAAQDEPPCDLNGNCISKCQDIPVTCGVEWLGVACELEGFTGATAQVACGQQVTVGTACCGGCGCVPVTLYFDGLDCWEGMPECTLPEFSAQLFNPHAPTTPNTSFTVPSDVPGTFYLGSGGYGGAATSGGTGGMSGGVGGIGGTSGGAGGVTGGTGGDSQR